jgi:hypothetical protein
VTIIEVLIVALRFFGLLLLVPGLWLVANGVRVVVSGRMDERRRAASALRLGIPLLVAGLLVLFGASWLTRISS